MTRGRLRSHIASLSIRTKLGLVYSALVGLISLFIFIYFPGRIQSQAMRSIAAKADSISAMMSYSFAPTLFFQDKPALEQVIAGAQQNQDLLYVMVFSTGDRLAAAWNPREAEREGFRQVDGGDPVSPGGDTYRASTPISMNNQTVGRLYFGLSLAGMQAEISRSRKAVAAVSLAVFLLGILAVFGVSAVITVPLSRVVETARQITQGDLTRRTPVRSRDEVGQLAEAFNRMVDHLAAAQQDLAHLNQGLEERVSERTLELRREVAERKQAEALLSESRERFALAARGSNDGIWDWDLRTDTVYYSPRWRSMLGFDPAETQGPPGVWFERVHPEDLEKLRAAVDAHLEGRTEHFWHEHRVRHAEGTYRWMLARGLAVRDAAGRAYRMAGSQTDITERKLAEEQLIHDALHDSLTGLPNRVLFMDRLAQALRRCRRRDDYRFAVLFMDLDRFKLVNDSSGHLEGDQFLRTVAGRLEGCLRAGDTVARLGGDEFAILVDVLETDSDALGVAERAQNALALPASVGGREVFTTVSIGVAHGSASYDRAEEILRDADTAMYRAKASGRGRCVVFQPGMHLHVVKQLQMESDLRRALEAREFEVFYQPIVEMGSGRIRGAEALVRWNHPERGQVPPGEFVPLAEETGLVVDLDRWVLQEAVTQAAAWQRRFPNAPPFEISVNISGVHLDHPDLLPAIRTVLADSGLEEGTLKVEITEGVILENASPIQTLLFQLRQMGVQVVIDDFGTGYSSLSYLHRFPVDILKVDRSFVAGIGGMEKRWEIVRTIVALAHGLGMRVIAEGVETPPQQAFLQALQCEYAQGYLFSRPLPASAFEALLLRSAGASKAQRA